MKSTPHILVSITDQPGSYRLISAGRRLADEQQLPLKVIAVLKNRQDEKNADVMQTLYNLCAKYRAELTILFHQNPALTVAITAKQTDAAHLICSTPAVAGYDFIAFLRETLPDIPLSIVEADGSIVTFPPCAVKTVS